MSKTELSAIPVALVEFEMPWCSPCKTQSAILDSLKAKYPVEVKRIDCFSEDDFVQGLGILSCPTTILYKYGKEICRFWGLTQEEKIIPRLETALI